MVSVIPAPGRLLVLLPVPALLASAPLSQQVLPTLYESPALVTSGTPTAFAVGDVDGDGLPDVAVTDLSGDGLTLFVQGADLGFARNVLAAGVDHEDVAMVDADGDSHLDLVAIRSGSPATLEVFLGDGRGGFSRGRGTTLSGQGTALAAADLDGDGHVDLAVTLGDLPAVEVLLGDGAGAFVPAGLAPVPAGAQRLVAGDLDGDGVFDLVVVGGEGGGLSTLGGLGDGTLAEASSLPSLGALDVALGDVDGDGDLDAVCAVLQRTILVFTNEGGVLQPYVRQSSGDASGGVDLFDRDGDGDLDVLMSVANGEPGPRRVRYGVDAFRVLENDGLGNFTVADSHGESDQGDALAAVLATDVDADGAVDALVLGPDRESVSLYRGDGAGGFLERGEAAAGFTNKGWIQLVPADMNADGLTDLVAASDTFSEVQVLTSDGTGQFGFSDFVPGYRLVRGLTVADFDGDGALDVGFYAPAGTVKYVGIALGTGSGQLLPPTTVAVTFPIEHMVAVDWNGDGAPDLVGGSEQSTLLQVRLGDGAGGFLARSNADFHANAEVGDLRAADLDGDGHPDLALLDAGADQLVLLLGDGAGGVAGRVELPLDPAHENLVVADLDRDGVLDLVTGGGASPVVAVRYGLGAARYSAPVTLAGGAADQLDVGDVDRDGWPDVMALSPFRLTLQRSDGRGGFQADHYDGDSLQAAAVILDADADGWADVVTARPGRALQVYGNRDLASARLGGRDGGTNPHALRALDRPVLGGPWTLALDTSLLPGATAGGLVVSDRGTAPTATPFGLLLVDVGPRANLLFAGLQPATGEDLLFPLMLPDDPALVGARLASQGFGVGAGVQLTNAVDAVLGRQ